MSNSRYAHILRKLAFGLSVLSPCLIPASLWAQTNLGEITGTVFDQTQAVVGGVAVSAANVATNVAQNATTNGNGIYALPNLTPGTYRLTLEKAGFNKVVREPITVVAGRTSQLDFNMMVGSTATEVSITADVPIVQTGTSTVQYGFDLKQVDELPVPGQSALQILSLLPGVEGNTGGEQAAISTGFTTPGAGLSVAGGAMGTTQFQADGVSNTSLYYGRISLPLSTDAISEMQVIQNSYSAEYRNGGGAVVSMITKSGTNQIHGTLFSFSQNDALNAAPWLKYNKKGMVRYWRGGVDVGGPVVIPKLYNGRNKTFFFANFEPLRQYTQAQNFSREATALERQGNFSQSIAQNTASQPTAIFQHFLAGTNTPIVASATNPYPMFPNATIPPSMISPIGQKVINQQPLPNMPLNASGQNYYFFGSVRNTDNRWLAKVDQVITNNHRMSARLAQVPTKGVRYNQGGYFESVPTDSNTGTNAVFSDTYTWGGNKVNEFRYGFNRSNNSRTQTPLQLSVNGYEMFGFPSFLTKGVPWLQSFDNNVTNYGLAVGTFETDNFFQASDTLNWVKGKHNLKIGIDWNATQQNLVNNQNLGGIWQFNASGTNIGNGNTQTVLGIPNATTGAGFATLLLGYPTFIQFATAVVPYQYRWKYWAGFFQDDWKATSRLTLNIGLRYQIEVPRVEKHNMQGNFIDQPVTLSTGATQLGYIQLGGYNGAPRTLWPTRYNNWEPRIGFAYRLPAIIPGLKVMRGAYAINHVPTSGLFQSAFPDLSPRPVGPASNGAANGGQVQMDFAPLQLPTGGIVIPANGLITNLNNVSSLAQMSQNVVIPYVQQWNFGFGFQWGRSTGLDILYVGSKSTNLFGPSKIYNAIDLDRYKSAFAAGLDMNAQVPNPQGIKNAAGVVTTVTRQNSFRPLSTVGDITNPTSQGYDANYNALHLNFTKRLSMGFQFNVSYVWMKSIDDSSCMGQYCSGGIQPWGNSTPQLLGSIPPDSNKLEKSISSFSIPQDFKLNYNWDIPIGRGKHFLNVQNGWINQIIGNWKTSGNFQLRSGYPFSVYSGTNAGWPDGVGAIRPNINSGVDPILPGWKAGCDNMATHTCPYLNSMALFSPPGYLQIGNAPRITNIRMPHGQIYNMAFLKEVTIHEQVKLTFRAEMYGALNHVFIATNSNNFTVYTGLNYQSAVGTTPTVLPNNINPAFADVSKNIGGNRTIQLGAKLYF